MRKKWVGGLIVTALTLSAASGLTHAEDELLLDYEEVTESFVDELEDAFIEEDIDVSYIEEEDTDEVLDENGIIEEITEITEVLGAAGSIPIDVDHFPDEVFREYILEWIDDGNAILDQAEISATKEINIHDQKDLLESLKGIEFFSELDSLYVYGENLAYLDVSQNTKLSSLVIASFKLATLDVTNNTELRILSFSCYNEITQLDLSHNLKLTDLDVAGAYGITSLDLSNNAALTYLDCSGLEALASLDLSNNIKLSHLNCRYTNITALNVRNHPALEELDCSYTKIEALDLTQNQLLSKLNCRRTKLTSLNVLNNPALLFLDCSGTNIEVLDLTKNQLLTTLDCGGTKLTNLNVSKNPYLADLSCSGLEATTIGLRNNTLLKKLDCSGADFEYLDLSKNTLLETLYLRDCYFLEELDISHNTALKEVSTWLCDFQKFIISLPFTYDFGWLYGLQDVYITGDYGLIEEDAFKDFTFTAYYPADNPTWTSDKLQNYGGQITWKQWDPATEKIIEGGLPVVYLSNGEEQLFEKTIVEYLRSENLRQYNPVLAHLCCALAESVYSEKQIRRTLIAQGFSEENIETTWYYGKWLRDWSLTRPGYAFAVDDNNNVIIIVRGTQDAGDICTDISFSMSGTDEHTGFSSSATHILNALNIFLDSKQIDYNDVHFVVTGHSLGGAVANIIAKRLTEKYYPSHVMAYSVATPKTVMNKYGQTYWNRTEAEVHPNIYNICNRQDPVTHVPRDLNLGKSFERYGTTYFFDINYGIFFENHGSAHYVDALKAEKQPDRQGFIGTISGLTRGMKLIGIFCPVDCTLYKDNGYVLAEFYDNGFLNLSDYVLAYIIDDAKYFLTPADEEYRVELTATDSGQMDYVVSLMNTTDEEIIEQKTFSNIPLVADKTMISYISAQSKAADVKLYEVDANNTSIIKNEIGVDGKAISTNHSTHTWSSWKTTKAATALQEGSLERTCTVCAKKETKSIAKLKATISLNVSGTLPIKVKQKTSKITMSGLAEGDSAATVTSSKPKIVATSLSGNNITLKAGKKTGKSVITVKTKAGATASFTVKVQKGAVKAKKVSVPEKTITLTKGKNYSVNAVVTPITCVTKLTFSTSKKSVATVSKKGVIKAKKKGKAKITVKCGSKKAVITVIVK